MQSTSNWSSLRRITSTEVVIPLLFIIIITPLMGLSAYIHPTDTDYSWILDDREKGLWGSYVYGYIEVTGRYMANLLAVLTPMPIDPAIEALTAKTLLLYRLAPVMGMFGLTLATNFFFQSILESARKWHTWVITLGLMAIYFGRLEHHGEILYWYQGNIQYLVPIITMMVCLSYLVRLAASNRNRDFLWCVWWGTLTIGGNETALVSINLIIVSVCASMWLSSHPLRTKFSALLGILLCFSLISFFSPANTVRDHIVSFQMEKKLLFAAYKSLMLSLKNGLYWMPVSITVGLLLIDYIQRKGIRLKPVLRGINLPWVTLVLVGCYVLAYFPNAWARGEANPPLRIVDVAQFLFMLGLILWMILMADSQRDRGFPSWISPATPATILLVITTICFFHMDGRIRRTYTDLFTKAETYDKEMMARYQAIRQSTSEEVALPPLSKVPETVFFRDILSNPDWWLNEQEARYFHKRKIYLTQPETSTEKDR
ncbi:MAG: hypothetical protein FJX89_03895 [Bacteroidetes bacterium]|nr:hypothetical protein [Bacteroidota bacterium]